MQMLGEDPRSNSEPLIQVVHRDRSAKIGDSTALFNIVCAMAGTGILQLPFTLKQAGWVGIAVIAIVGLMACYTAIVLMKCLYPDGELGKRLLGYPDIGFYAFGKPGRFAVQIFHKATLVGVCTLYLILAAKFLAETFFEGSHQDWWVKKLTLGVAGIQIIPCVFLRTLHEVGFMSVFGILSSLLVVVVVVVFSIRQRVNHGEDISYDTLDYKHFPQAFSAITLSFGGHATLPTIESHSSSPRNFRKILYMAFGMLMLMYIPPAITGYLAYGQNTASPILCNFSSSSVVVKITKVIFAAHVVTAYPILMHVVFHEVEQGWKRCEDIAFRFPVRLFFVAISAVTAYFVPYFADFMTLIGAFCVTAMVFVFPIICDFKIRYRTLTKFEWVFGLLVMCVGITAGSIGGYNAAKHLIHLIRTDAPPTA